MSGSNNAPRELLIRVDTGLPMGTGLLMRCLALAQAWKAQGGAATFLSHCPMMALRERVEAAGFPLVLLDTPYPDPGDLEKTLGLLRRSKGSWLVLDGPHLAPDYQRAVRDAGYKTLVVDDAAHWPEYPATAVLNHNIDAEELPYQRYGDTHFLLGPRYTLLRSEFEPWRGWQRTTPQRGDKLLVSLGGGDPDNVTFIVLLALEMGAFPGLETVVVVGPANPHIEHLEEHAAASRHSIRLVSNATNMPELMAWADVAITGAGTTCLELAFMGLPSLVIVIAEAQRRMAAGLNRAGAASSLGDIQDLTAGQISRALEKLRADRSARAALTQRGRDLIDGLGAQRVAQQLRAWNTR